MMKLADLVISYANSLVSSKSLCFLLTLLSVSRATNESVKVKKASHSEENHSSVPILRCRSDAFCPLYYCFSREIFFHEKFREIHHSLRLLSWLRVISVFLCQILNREDLDQVPLTPKFFQTSNPVHNSSMNLSI